MTDLLDRMLAKRDLSVVFQPVFDIAGEEPVLVGMEALTRGPRGTHFENAAVLFDYVRLKHREVAVDRYCVANALAAAAELPPVPRISVNVHASTLERDPEFATLLAGLCAEHGIDVSTVVVEIVEQSPYWEVSRLLAVLRKLRSIGIGVAVDDVGFGHCNYRMILDARPEYLKVDRYFVTGCGADPYRRSLLRSVCQLASDFGSVVVAEGIETEEDLAAVRELRIHYGQGFLLAVPSAMPELNTFRIAACADRARQMPI
jgi:EAL domain-containing protein (putative c-di-GMP-specific phosphodiesterase class I)